MIKDLKPGVKPPIAPNEGGDLEGYMTGCLKAFKANSQIEIYNKLVIEADRKFFREQFRNTMLLVADGSLDPEVAMTWTLEDARHYLY